MWTSPPEFPPRPTCPSAQKVMPIRRDPGTPSGSHLVPTLGQGWDREAGEAPSTRPCD